MSMSNNIDQSTALQALGWELLNIMRRKAKTKLIYKVLNKMAPEPLTKLFTYKNEITNHKHKATILPNNIRKNKNSDRIVLFEIQIPSNFCQFSATNV